MIKTSSHVKRSLTTNDVKVTKPKNSTFKLDSNITPTLLNEGSSDVSDKSSEIDDQSQLSLGGFESDEDKCSISSTNNHNLELVIKSPKDSVEKQENTPGQERDSESPGVIYVSRIPHGFYEHEMRAYFAQFGNVMNLRLSRNKKTGASKHRAWIKFESVSTAEIVAKSMDNYLMFGHLLKVKLLSDDQIPTTLFKGSNRRFKKVPWNKIEGRKLMQPRSREAWLKRIQREEKRRLNKATKLKDLGYEYELPEVRLVKSKT